MKLGLAFFVAGVLVSSFVQAQSYEMKVIVGGLKATEEVKPSPPFSQPGIYLLREIGSSRPLSFSVSKRVPGTRRHDGGGGIRDV